jgi:hypothetical protein
VDRYRLETLQEAAQGFLAVARADVAAARRRRGEGARKAVSAAPDALRKAEKMSAAEETAVASFREKRS